MRSVFVFLRDATEAEAAGYLDRAYPAGREPWLVLCGEDPCLYIDFYRDAHREYEPEEWADLVGRFGGEPVVGVVADVSGRHPGSEQTSAFVIDLLGRFSGAAMDEYSSHLWSLAELRAGHLVSGHRFFDYKGWFVEPEAAG